MVSRLPAAATRTPPSTTASPTCSRCPDEWLHAFDLVVESLTVQSLPVALRGRATAAVAGLVAPGGSLLVVAAARDDDGSPVDGPPWPLTRAQVDAFAGGGLETVRVEDLRDATQPTVRRWRAEFRR